jgi:hypothetical protein
MFGRFDDDDALGGTLIPGVHGSRTYDRFPVEDGDRELGLLLVVSLLLFFSFSSCFSLLEFHLSTIFLFYRSLGCSRQVRFSFAIEPVLRTDIHVALGASWCTRYYVVLLTL